MNTNIDAANLDPRARAAAAASGGRLVHDASPGAYAVRVCCVGCDRQYQLAHVVADTEGRAFVDYYCPRCACGTESRS